MFNRAPGRDVPPLVIAALALLVLLAALPSALNVSAANPSETLEYAPVPPEDEQTNPPMGNFSSLGLGGSSSAPAAAASAAGSGAEAEGLPVGGGKSPSTKRCVGSPPRQTEDPLSPPCVAFFSGSNGGATYQGVTESEIRILVAFDGGTPYSPTSRGTEVLPGDAYFDMAEPPPDGDEDVLRRTLRSWQLYFNDRYQTYGRFVHFFAYYSKPDYTPEARRAQAIANFERVKPFAVITSFGGGNREAYVGVMSRRGVLHFGGSRFQHGAYHGRYPGLTWNYFPTLEQFARQFASYVCTKVAPYPVSFSGNVGDQGRPRKYGFVSTSEPTRPELARFADAVEAEVGHCGVEFAARGSSTPGGPLGVDQDAATEQMAEFSAAGVTTIIWAAAMDGAYSRGAGSLGYRPEWVVAGDGQTESLNFSPYQDQSVWSHAWVVTNLTREASGSGSEPCQSAYAEANPAAPRDDLKDACQLFDRLRMLFTGIQVAGPRLTPATMERGYRAIPAIASADPTVPACYYEAGDYSCVKDATAMWWDPNVASDYGTTGCWRMPERGKRYLTGQWPEGDVIAQRRPDDVCNTYVATAFQ